MNNASVRLDQLANSMRSLKNGAAILYIIATSDERGQNIYNSLKKVEAMVGEFEDTRLSNLYQKLFAGFLSGVPHQQITPDDYFAFLNRIGTLLGEATVQANEAHLALREEVRLKTAIGTWAG